MKISQRPWGRLLQQRSRRGAICTLLLVAAGSAATTSVSADDASAAAGANAIIASDKCGSLVIRRCRLRTTATMVVDPDLPLRGISPLQWQQVRSAGPDSEEIVVSGERIREPTPGEVFDRYFGSPLISPGLVSRDAGGGGRCTTIVRTGATLCSNSGNVLPGMGTPVTSFSFSF